jgi:hypothetical protein
MLLLLFVGIQKDVFPDAKTNAQRFLKGMGATHMVTTGLLVATNRIEERDEGFNQGSNRIDNPLVVLFHSSI